jgi:hypothetical protein
VVNSEFATNLTHHWLLTTHERESWVLRPPDVYLDFSGRLFILSFIAAPFFSLQDKQLVAII